MINICYFRSGLAGYGLALLLAGVFKKESVNHPAAPWWSLAFVVTTWPGCLRVMRIQQSSDTVDARQP